MLSQSNMLSPTMEFVALFDMMTAVGMLLPPRFMALITASAPGTTPPALLQSPDRESILPISCALSISVDSLCRLRLGNCHLMLKSIVKLVADDYLKASCNASLLSCLLKAGTLRTDVRASAGFLSGKVNGHFSLRGTDHTDEIPLGEALSTAGAPSFGHLFGFNCRILHYMSMRQILTPLISIL